MVWAAGALLSAVYIANIPIMLAVAAIPGEAFGIGIGAFWAGGALLRARRRAAGLEAKSELRMLKLPDKRARMRFSWHLVKRAKLEWLELSGRAHIGDAMTTALIAGALYSARHTVYNMTQGRVRITLTPDFTQTPANVELSGILSLKLGHIIVAACKFAAKLKSEGDRPDGQASD